MARAKSIRLPRVALPDVQRALAEIKTACDPVLAMTLGEKVSVPDSATSPGVPGQWAADSSYLYVATDHNAWKRVALAGW